MDDGWQDKSDRWSDYPYAYALPKDKRYRDLCVKSGSAQFDSNTGQVNAEGSWKSSVPQVCGADSPGGCQDSSTYPLSGDCESTKSGDCKDEGKSGFDEQYVGRVTGSKISACMPVKDTAYYTTRNQYDNTAFINYLTIDAIPDYAKSIADDYGSLNSGDPVRNEVSADPAVSSLSNYYLDATRFIGGTLGCPDFIVPIQDLPTSRDEWHDPQVFKTFVDWMSDKAGYCYYYYILNRAVRPWLALDRPGLSTDDPLTNSDPNAAVLQTCQPLIKGDAADKIEFPDSTKASQGNMTKFEVRSGFTEVRYNAQRLDASEAEYNIGGFLKSEWNDLFVNFTGDGKYKIDPKLTKDQSSDKGIIKDFQDTFTSFGALSMPCIEDWTTYEYLRIGGVYGYVGKKWGQEGCGTPSSCKVYYHSAPGIQYPDPPIYNDYCPNVEKIIDPMSPFSPRDQIIQSTQTQATARIWDGEYPKAANNPQPASSDRGYSAFTSIYYTENFTASPAGKQENGACYYQKCGYTSYNCIMPLNPYPNGEWSWTWNLKRKYPPVQCAVVPVDILTFRFEGFHSCIMQRIAINFNRWIDAGSPNFMGTLYYTDTNGNKGQPDVDGINKQMAKDWTSGKENSKTGKSPEADLAWGVFGKDENGAESWADPNLADRYGTGYSPRTGGYKPACSTRYWETDNVGVCPTPTSIQQCCRFILKDLVPINFLKIRTCEGLLEQRRSGASKSHNGTDLDSRLRALNFWGYTLHPEYLYDPDKHGDDPPPSADAVAWITDDIVGAPNGDVGSIWYGESDALAQHLIAEAATRMLNDTNCTTSTANYKSAHELWFSKTPFVETFTDPYSNETVGVHMPYMRWWDTGVSAGNPHRGGSFTNTLGGWDAFVGVGREEVTTTDSYYANHYSDDFKQSHLDGSKYTTNTRGSEVSRIDGWRGMLAHQMQSIRRYGLNCITRFEKTSKPYSGEDFVLASAGGSFNNKNGEKMAWPFGWRGYLSAASYGGYSLMGYANVDTNNGEPSPHYGGFSTETSGQLKGLDYARKGDIIFYPLSDYQWHIAYVEEAGYTPDTDRGGGDDSWDFEKGAFSGMSDEPVNDLYVVSWDQGRFPTATGATTYLGIGGRHQILKYKVPDYYQQKVCQKSLRALTEKGEKGDGDIQQGSCSDPASSENDSSGCSDQCQPSCDDPDYKYCVLPTFGSKKGWDYAYIYRPSIHDWTSRVALSTTQDWWDKQIKTPEDPVKMDNSGSDDDKPIMQGMTYKHDSGEFAQMVNQGMDPPWFWFMGNYRGPGTGAVTKLTFIGGKWGQNNGAAPKNIVRCFRGNGDGGEACDLALPDIPLQKPIHCGFDPDMLFYGINDDDCDILLDPCEYAFLMGIPVTNCGTSLVECCRAAITGTGAVTLP